MTGSFLNIAAILEGEADTEAGMDEDDGCSVACSTLSTLSSAEGSQKDVDKEEGNDEDEKMVVAGLDVKDNANKKESPIDILPPTTDQPSHSPQSLKPIRLQENDVKVSPIPILPALTMEDRKPLERCLSIKTDDSREGSGEERNGESRMDEDDDAEMRTWAETPKKGASAAAPAAASAAQFDFMGQDAPKIRRACAYCHQKKGTYFIKRS